MTSQLEYGTVSNPEDARQLGVIISQCFNDQSPNGWQTYSNRIGLENFRVIRQAGQIIGGLSIYQMGQWYGARIPMAGIASVGVSPEHRGTGAAVELLSHTLKELYANGVPLSTLYAATQRPYRKVGYEQGGNFCTWEIPTDSIQIRSSILPMQPVIPVCRKVFHDLYHQQAKVTNGHLDRNPAIWERIESLPKEEIVYAYLIGSETQPEGYIIFSQGQEDDSCLIFIRDWVVLTPAALRRFWTFLAAHRSIVKKVRWRSSTVDPLILLLPEQTAKIHRSDRWMLRVIDVSKALEKRGYPLGIETELHLEVRDNLLAENNGKFVLSVSNGRGEVKKGGKGELQLDVCGLAPLYTGLFTPHQLQLTGQLEANEIALLSATQLFAGSQPWMPDFF